jgi:hypothetical protein
MVVTVEELLVALWIRMQRRWIGRIGVTLIPGSQEQCSAGMPDLYSGARTLAPW